MGDMTQEDAALVARLIAYADSGDFGRKPDPDGLHRRAADAITRLSADAARVGELERVLERLERANDEVARCTTRERYLTDLADVQPALLELDDARRAARAALTRTGEGR